MIPIVKGQSISVKISFMFSMLAFDESKDDL